MEEVFISGFVQGFTLWFSILFFGWFFWQISPRNKATTMRLK